MVLGELIEDESGKITGHRILDVEGPKVERSFVMHGNTKRWRLQTREPSALKLERVHRDNPLCMQKRGA